jgi:hypothetical protein
MMENELRITLTETSGIEFFDILEKHLDLKIPKSIKNVLTFNQYDTIYTLSEFNNDSISEIQECMRHIFEKDMIDDEENIADYLGKFTKVQSKFILLSGELKLINIMVETCRRLYALQPEVSPSHEEYFLPQQGKQLRQT